MRNSRILQVNLSISVCGDLSFEQQQEQKGSPNENWASFRDELVEESIEENLNVSNRKPMDSMWLQMGRLLAFGMQLSLCLEWTPANQQKVNL